MPDFDAIAALITVRQRLRFFRKTVLADFLAEEFGKGGFHMSELNPVLRTLRASQRRRNRGQIERAHFFIVDLPRTRLTLYLRPLQIIVQRGDGLAGAA